MSSPPPDDSTRFAPITASNHSGILWIASLLAGVYSTLSLFVRCYIKRDCWGRDDWICAAATLVGLASFIATYVGLSQGLGKLPDDNVDVKQHLHAISQSVFASQITLIVALCLSKCSVIFLIRRLFSQDMRRHRISCDVLVAMVVVWGFASMIGVSVRCDPNALFQPWLYRCSGQLLRWRLIGIFDAISEIAIFVLSFALVWQLQMRLELKIRVILAFIFRLPLVPVIVLHIYYMKSATDRPNRTMILSIIPALVCEQSELGYSLLSATIPNLKSFIMRFDTAMMMDVGHKLHPEHTYLDDDGQHPSGSSLGQRAPSDQQPERKLHSRGLRPNKHERSRTSSTAAASSNKSEGGVLRLLPSTSGSSFSTPRTPRPYDEASTSSRSHVGVPTSDADEGFHAIMGRLRPEKLEHVASIAHVEDGSRQADSEILHNGEIGGLSREGTPGSAIRKDVQWFVEERFR